MAREKLLALRSRVDAEVDERAPDGPPEPWPEFTDGGMRAYYGHLQWSYQCGVEQLIYPEVPPGVRSKGDWHALCSDPDCECLEHDHS